MLCEMDSPELTYWEALYIIEPMPEQRADLRAGTVASAALAPHMKRGAAPPRPIDMVPDYDAPPPDPMARMKAMKQTFQSVKAMFDQKKAK